MAVLKNDKVVRLLGLCHVCTGCSCGEVGRWLVTSLGNGSTGEIYYSVDLKIPVSMYFLGDSVEKAKDCLIELKICMYVGSKNIAGDTDVKLQAEYKGDSNVELAKKFSQSGAQVENDVDAKIQIGSDCSTDDSAAWMTVKDITLMEDDRKVMVEGKLLLNYAQKVIDRQFPSINWLQLSLVQYKPF